MVQSAFYRGVELVGETLRRCTATTPGRRAAEVHTALQQRLDATPTAAARACARGCTHCCHFPVGVTFGEALRIAAAIGTRPELRAAFAAASAAVARLPWSALVGVPCPLLRDGACAAYEVRPLPCRAMASRDAAACAQALAGGPPPPLDAEAFWLGLGAADALAAAERTRGVRELRAAVLAVLSHPPGERAEAFTAAREPPP